MNKICTKCDYIKPTDLFPKSEQSQDGYFDICKKCINSGTVAPTAGLVPNVNVVYTPTQHRVVLSPIAPSPERNAVPPKEDSWDYPPKREKRKNTKHQRHGIEYRTPEELIKIQKNYALSSSYGITLEEFDKMLESQGNCCSICKSAPKRKYHPPYVVDFNKEARKVRGILCRQCKLIIINAESSTDKLFTVIEYLEKNK